MPRLEALNVMERPGKHARDIEELEYVVRTVIRDYLHAHGQSVEALREARRVCDITARMLAAGHTV